MEVDVLEKVEDLEEQVKDMEADVLGIETTQKAMWRSLRAINRKLEEHDNRFNVLEVRTESIEELLIAMNNSIDQIKNYLKVTAP